MRNVHSMNQRMTHWTNHHKVFSFIVFSISIDMMYAKDIFLFIISAFFTGLNNSFSFPKPTKVIGTIWLCFMQISCSICAYFRTIFSYSRWRIQEKFSTQKTFMMFFSTDLRTIFSSFQPIKRYFKIYSTTHTQTVKHICP